MQITVNKSLRRLRLAALLICFISTAAWSQSEPFETDCDNPQCPPGWRVVSFFPPLTCICYPPDHEGPCGMQTQYKAFFFNEVLNQYGPGKLDYMTPDATSILHEVVSSEIAVMRMRIPLGKPAYIQFTGNLSDATGANCTPQSLDFTYTQESQQVSPALSAADQRYAIFKDTVVLPFAAQSNSHALLLYPFHLGTSTYLLTPTDPTYPPQRLEITVEAPIALPSFQDLPSNHSDYDLMLIEWAHRSGLPPHLLKAVVQHESANTFNPASFRYEPVTIDCELFDATQLNRTPYKDYRLPDGQDLILPNDIDPRNVVGYKFRDRNSHELRLLISEDDATAAELVEANPRQNWVWSTADLKRYAKNHIPLDGHRACHGKMLTEVDVNTIPNFWIYNSNRSASDFAIASTVLNFPAQTTVAASYGLMQILYSTAIDLAKWKGENGFFNPSYLIDPAISIPLSINYLTRMGYKIKSANPFTSRITYNELREFFHRSLVRYNSNRTIKAINDKDYGAKVLTKFNDYIVVQNLEPIFY